jgi:hypothetical protein
MSSAKRTDYHNTIEWNRKVSLLFWCIVASFPVAVGLVCLTIKLFML